MCTPAALPYALAGAQGILGASNQSKQFGSQKSAAGKIADAAEQSAVRQYTALQARQEEEQARAVQSIQKSRVEATKALGTLTTQAGESGVGGNSVRALHDEFARTATEYEGAVIRNKAFLDSQFKRDAEGIQLNQQSTINNAYSQIQPPNYLGLILQTAGSALAIKHDQDALKPPGASTTDAYTPHMYNGVDVTPFG